MLFQAEANNKIISSVLFLNLFQNKTGSLLKPNCLYCFSIQLCNQFNVNNNDRSKLMSAKLISRTCFKGLFKIYIFILIFIYVLAR